jgi:hypothetical protein
LDVDSMEPADMTTLPRTSILGFALLTPGMSDIVTRYRSLPPSGQADMHADLCRDPNYGAGFANLLRDLCDSPEVREGAAPLPAKAA